MSGGRRGPRAAPRYPQEAYDPATGYGYSYGYDEFAWEAERPGRLVTPGRFLLVLVAIVAGGVALYGLFFDRTELQIPIAVSGLAIFGTALLSLALISAQSAASLGRDGFGGRAFLAAMFGGLCALGAAGSLAGAFVLGILVL